MLPLEGVRVVEFAHMVMGPSCGLVLADLGAEVIKVEPLAGDNTRRLEHAGAGFFPVFNRNKKSLAIDLKHPEGRALVIKLVERSDVLTENFRPGALDKLNSRLLEALNDSGAIYLTQNLVRGAYAIRLAIGQTSTERRHVEAAWALIQKTARSMK